MRGVVRVPINFLKNYIVIEAFHESIKANQHEGPNPKELIPHI
jgi:hypothetical protein